MIRSVRATAGYAAQLASLKDRVFDFGPGLYDMAVDPQRPAP